MSTERTNSGLNYSDNYNIKGIFTQIPESSSVWVKENIISNETFYFDCFDEL